MRKLFLATIAIVIFAALNVWQHYRHLKTKQKLQPQDKHALEQAGLVINGLLSSLFALSALYNMLG